MGRHQRAVYAQQMLITLPKGIQTSDSEHRLRLTSWVQVSALPLPESAHQLSFLNLRVLKGCTGDSGGAGSPHKHWLLSLWPLLPAPRECCGPGSTE